METGGIVAMSAIIALMYHIAVRDDYIKKYGKTDGDKKAWVKTFIAFVIMFIVLSFSLR